MPYTEFNVVEKPIIDWLVRLGWRFVSADELKRGIEEPFDLPTLIDRIKYLNPDLDTDEDVDKVISQLRRASNDISGNREIFEWVKGKEASS